MLVLHGFFLPGAGLHLWAEDAELPVKSPSQALRSARPHPFAASSDALARWYDGTASETDLLLPSLRSAPLDSPGLVRTSPRPARRTDPVLLPWTVPTLVLKEPAALAALGESPEDIGVEIRRGASIDFFARLADFSRALVARGRVVPYLDLDGAGASARWRPAWQGHDVVDLQALTSAMPAVCRAVPGHDDAAQLVAAAMEELVDAAARERFGGADGSGAVRLAPPRPGRRPRLLPADEGWLTALSAPSGGFEADDDQLEALAGALRPWAELGRAGDGLARATFRLVEPGAERSDEYDADPLGTDAPTDSAEGSTADPTADHVEDERWRLEFFLQSTTDLSLLVPASQVWDDDGGLDRWLPRPQELLLAELGRASTVSALLADGLRQARPSELELDAAGALEFLSTAAPALDEAGFGVLLPSWWNRRQRLGLNLSAHTPVDGVVTRKGKLGKDQLVRFRWDLAVGDQVLSEAEMAALSAAKAPLIRLRGQWVVIDADQLQRGLAFLKRKPTGRRSAAQILALAATHPDDTDTPLPVTGVRADGWLGDLLDGTMGQSIRPMDMPAGLDAELRPYQLRGLSWLAFLESLGLGACLADDMGLGKTVQLLALEVAHRAENPGAAASLLLCPMSLVGNWQREASRFAPGLRVYAHHGRARLGGEELREKLEETDLVVTTYATATRDIEELAGFDWQRVVLDEAQAIKNGLSRSAKAAKRLSGAHRVALTGTPMENRLAELWSIMDFCNPGMLGTSEDFRTRYAIPVERHGQTEPAERLRRVTRPYVLRRLKTDPAIIDDLPEKIEIKQYCRLSSEQAALYQSVVDDMMERIENSKGIERRGNVLATMTKLKQVCNHPALLLHDRSAIGSRSGKVARLEEILEELLAEGDRALCFTQYTEFAEMLLPHLAVRFDTDVSYLHGGTSKRRRDELVADFQSGEGAPLFLLSLKAGGTGLNLTAANHVIHLDRWWNPAVEDQATDRAFRIGQKQNVQVRKFITTGTLEEKIDEMIEEKKELASLVVRDGEGWLTELSTRDLRDVFALSPGAADE